MTVRRLNQKDCLTVARLHMGALPTPFAGGSGEALLTLYYRSVTMEQGAMGYAAVNADDDVIGFVCGVWNPGQLRRYLIKRHGFSLLWWGSLQFGQRPQIFTSLPGRLRRTPPNLDTGVDISYGGYELRPIVVAKEARGTGTAGELVETLLQDARQRGFTEMHLFAEPDNLAACKFYDKVGFAADGQGIRDGRPVVRYRYHV
ncbi:MAG: GNAT family N-acetyltransferase [Chloroflexi bacterium]|nr:GNAT family N-acetyltransferase [Chloroflexota bacterium]